MLEIQSVMLVFSTGFVNYCSFFPSHLEAYFQPEPRTWTTLFVLLSPGGILPDRAQVMDNSVYFPLT
jgi:hypothetical protein